MKKEALKKELERMACGQYSAYKIEDLTPKIEWLFKWRKITNEEKNELVDLAILVMKQGGYSIFE